MTETYDYTPRVTLCGDGFYRWSYEVDMSSKGAVFASMVKVCAIISLALIAVAAVMTPEIVTYAALAALGIVGLPALLWVILYRGRAARQTMRFGMNEEKIHVPGLYKSEFTSFSQIRGVTLRPGEHLIELRTITMTLIQIFVPDEDFEFVQGFIVDHVPPSANVYAEA